MKELEVNYQAFDRKMDSLRQEYHNCATLLRSEREKVQDLQQKLKQCNDDWFTEKQELQEKIAELEAHIANEPLRRGYL